MTPAMTVRSRHRSLAALLCCLLVLCAQVVAAGPAAAHAELVSTDPGDGARLDRPPSEVGLRFTEEVNLTTGGLQLLDASGDPVATGDPVAEGDTVRWPMPATLPQGGYLVSWRVISSDGHPVAGAFSFGVGSAPPPVRAPDSAAPTVPWPVTLARFGGYLGFTLLAGVVAFAVACWARGRDHALTQTLLRTGVVLAVLSTALALLVQGPYGAGQPMSRLFDAALLAQTAGTGFGAWTQVRLALLLAFGAVLWPRGALSSRSTRWLAALAVTAIAATFPGTGHAAAGGSLVDLVVDAVHVLLAGTWVGGLVLLAVTALGRGDRPDLPAVAAFSRLALACVAGLLVTGTVNSVLRLERLSAVWESDYGRLLVAKIAVLAVVLAAAASSRRRLHRLADLRGTVRVEAVAAVAVLAVTAVLASAVPPTTLPARATEAAPGTTTVEMELGDGRLAAVHVDPPSRGGSSLHVELLGSGGRPLRARSVTLQATLPERQLGPLEVPLDGGPSDWTGDVTFPLAGEWRLTLTVEDRGLTALVTSGVVRIS